MIELLIEYCDKHNTKIKIYEDKIVDNSIELNNHVLNLLNNYKDNHKFEFIPSKNTNKNIIFNIHLEI